MSPALKLFLAVQLLAVTAYGQELRVTASNSINFLYVDDVQLTPLDNSGDWRQVDRVPIEPFSRLVAIRANNVISGCSGVMVASFDTDYPVVSNRTWKCHNSPPNGWQFLGFDDSNWTPAHEVGFNGEIVTGCSWFIIPEMPQEAHWIWTENYFDGDQIVSCRGYSSVCQESPCQNGATCNINSPKLCTCPVRWTGTFCELPHDECVSQPCQNGGVCNLDDSGYNCECPLGFSGRHCEIDISDCASSPCQFGGTCNFDIEGGYTCSCVDGYTGMDCETNINECDSEPCLNGGICVDGVNSASCVCLPGYSGLACQIDINECESNPCLNAATCLDRVNGYVCQCHSGFTGALCEAAIGACMSDPCQNGGTCTLSGPGGNVQCICTPGWSGPLCTSNENECLSNPCRNGGICEDGDGGYICHCVDEFNGPNCEFVVPNCGTIMSQSGFPATNKFEILCEINIFDHRDDVQTPCDQLLKGLNYYDDAETLLRNGGNFGCYRTRFPDEVNSACVPDYNQKVTLESCLSCTHMGICIDYPDSMKSLPEKPFLKKSFLQKK